MNILVVDDEATIRRGIKRTIETSFPHLNVSLADSAEEALQYLREHPVDLMLLDIMMPRMSGIELMGILRNKHPHLKWIVISAHSEFTFAQEALRLGASDYILKPVGKQKLQEKVLEMEMEWHLHKQNVSEKDTFQTNLRYFREAVFRRWAQGLDIGRFDMSVLADQHPHFHLILVRLQTNDDLNVRHFVVENVLGELIGMHGKGLIAGLDGQTLLGIVTLDSQKPIKSLEEAAKVHLNRAFKLPYTLQISPRFTDFASIPDEVRSMQMFEKSEDSTLICTSAGKSSLETIDIALQYIKSNFNDNLSLKKVASIVFLNPIYFSQLFKQKTGFGYKQYVTQLRMERAKTLLVGTNMKIIDIAYAVGYHDIRHFTQIFLQKYRMTPSEQRASLASSNAAPTTAAPTT